MQRTVDSLTELCKGWVMEWMRWGDAAFAKAQEEEKPIFLHIGYPSCQWCQAMDRESFSREDVAEALERTFVNVRVDREEFPEVDSLYMDFAQVLMEGGGGWPLHLVLTGEAKPFFAATYLLPEQILSIVEQVGAGWQEHREEIESGAEELMQSVRKESAAPPGEMPTKELVDSVAELFLRMGDSVHGGLQGAPKFPMPMLLDFLWEWGESRARFFVTRTLEKMAQGEIHDPNGGFCRYCVDEAWKEPHLEKMLHVNAMLARTYLRAGMEDVARETCDFLLRELQREDGGFSSAQIGEGRLVPSWNGLAIRALMEVDYEEAARSAAELFRDEALLRVLEDFACVISGLLTLGEVEWARKLAERVEEKFSAPQGGYYRTDGTDPHLLMRRVELYDGAEPSGSAVHCENLLRLHEMTGEELYLERAKGIMRLATDFLTRHPLGGVGHVAAIQKFLA